MTRIWDEAEIEAKDKERRKNGHFGDPRKNTEQGNTEQGNTDFPIKT